MSFIKGTRHRNNVRQKDKLAKHMAKINDKRWAKRNVEWYPCCIKRTLKMGPEGTEGFTYTPTWNSVDTPIHRIDEGGNVTNHSSGKVKVPKRENEFYQSYRKYLSTCTFSAQSIHLNT